MNRSKACRIVFARWAVLLMALFAELLLLTVQFDARGLANTGLLADSIAQARFLPEMAIAIARRPCCWSREGLGYASDSSGSALPRRHKRRNSAGLRGRATDGVCPVRDGVDTLFLDQTQTSRVWLAIWPALAGATLVLWFGAIAAYRSWFALMRREARVLAAGAGVGCLAWSMGRLTQLLWKPLGDATFIAVAAILRQFYPQVLVQPADRILGVGSFSVEIAPHCSGFDGIGLVAVFLSVFLWVFRRQLRFPQALLLLPAGLVGIWVGNSLRIAALIALGASWSPDVALGGFHSQAGWISFNLLSLGLATAALRIPFFLRAQVASASSSAKTPVGPAQAGDTAAYLVPFLAMTATSMVCSALQTSFDGAYPLKVVAAGLAVWCFRGAYRRLKWTWSWVAFATGTGVFALWMALDLMTGTTHESTLPADLSRLGPGWAIAWIVLRVIGSVITVPLAEELAFRGYLMRRWGSLGFEQVPSRAAHGRRS